MMRAMASDHTKRKTLPVTGYCSRAETLAKCDWQERSVVMDMIEHNHKTADNTDLCCWAVAVTDGHNKGNYCCSFLLK